MEIGARRDGCRERRQASAEAGSAGREPEPAMDVREVFRRQAEHFEALGSPVYARLAETPPVTRSPLRGLLGDGQPDFHVPLRLFGAVHSLVLTGVAPDALSGDWDDFAAALADHAERSGVRSPSHGVQTNEVQRCIALLPAFLTVAARGGTPARAARARPERRAEPPRRSLSAPVRGRVVAGRRTPARAARRGARRHGAGRPARDGSCWSRSRDVGSTSRPSMRRPTPGTCCCAASSGRGSRIACAASTTRSPRSGTRRCRPSSSVATTSSCFPHSSPQRPHDAVTVVFQTRSRRSTCHPPRPLRLGVPARSGRRRRPTARLGLVAPLRRARGARRRRLRARATRLAPACGVSRHSSTSMATGWTGGCETCPPGDHLARQRDAEARPEAPRAAQAPRRDRALRRRR